MIEVSLKQARRIESELDRALPNANATISSVRNARFKSEQAAISELEKAVNLARERSEQLIDVRFHIRALIDKANANSGINELCGKIAELEARCRNAQNYQQSFSAVYELSSGKDTYTQYATFIPEKVNEYITRLRFEISELKDRATGLNSQTKISLHDSVVDVIRSVGIPL